MADEPAATVVVENGPSTAQAQAAAQAASVAAASAIENATEVAAAAQREAKKETAEIAAETIAVVREQEDRLQWLRDHAESQSQRSTALASEVTETRKELGTLREALTGLGTMLQSLASQLSTPPQSGETPTVEPSKSGDAEGHREAKTQPAKRRRRLI